MTLVPALVVAVAAFCIWLTVRIVNRRERWAKWTLAGVVGVPLLYVASVGPAAWVVNQPWRSARLLWALVAIYYPLDRIDRISPQPIRDALDWYVDLWR
jgi:hypothetical protein